MNAKNKNLCRCENNDKKVYQDDACLLIGTLALKHNFINKDQLHEAVSTQLSSQPGARNLYLGEVLVFLEMISLAQLDLLLSVQKMAETTKRDVKFGQIAVKNAFATTHEINTALNKQKYIYQKSKTVELLGDILVESNTLTAEQRDQILIKQKRIKKTYLSSTTYDH